MLSTNRMILLGLWRKRVPYRSKRLFASCHFDYRYLSFKSKPRSKSDFNPSSLQVVFLVFHSFLFAIYMQDIIRMQCLWKNKNNNIFIYCTRMTLSNHYFFWVRRPFHKLAIRNSLKCFLVMSTFCKMNFMRFLINSLKANISILSLISSPLPRPFDSSVVCRFFLCSQNL